MVQCLSCEKWVHASCDNIDKDEYQKYNSKDLPYFCPNCKPKKGSLQLLVSGILVYSFFLEFSITFLCCYPQYICHKSVLGTLAILLSPVKFLLLSISCVVITSNLEKAFLLWDEMITMHLKICWFIKANLKLFKLHFETSLEIIVHVGI